MTKTKKTAVISLVVGLLGVVGIFVPSLLGIDGFDGGFAIAAVCVVISLTAFICAVVFWWMSRKEDKLKNGENFAHWTYTDDEWQKFAQLEKGLDASYKKTLYVIIVVFAVLCGGGFWIMDPENGVYVAYAMLGLIVFMGLVAFISIKTSAASLKRKGEAYISKDGVIMNGAFHAWSLVGSRFEDAAYHQENDPKYIEFTYSFVARYGRQTAQVRVPVPKEHEQDAAAVIAKVTDANRR